MKTAKKRSLYLPGLEAPEYRSQLTETLPVRDRPVHRVAEAGCDVCSTTELLAAVIGGAHQLEIAYSLLKRFEDLPGIDKAQTYELAEVAGIGRASASRLKAAFELGRRLLLAKQDDRMAIRSPSDVAQLLIAEMSHLEQENFRVLFLDSRNQLLGSETVYVGTLNSSHVRVAEVFRDAIKRNCAAIIVAHNHPSGDPSPSPEDVEVTRKIVAAGTLLNIDVLDHLTIGQQRYVSLRERGLGF